MTKQDIFDGLQELFPDGFVGLNPAVPSPSSYAEYVAALLPKVSRVSENDLQAAADITQAARAARAATATAIDSARTALVEKFDSMPFGLRKKHYYLRTTLKLALENGDIDIAQGLVEDLVPANQAEQTLKDELLALFP